MSRAETMVRLWAGKDPKNPDYRRTCTEGSKKRWATDSELRARQSAIMKAIAAQKRKDTFTFS